MNVAVKLLRRTFVSFDYDHLGRDVSCLRVRCLNNRNG